MVYLVAKQYPHVKTLLLDNISLSGDLVKIMEQLRIYKCGNVYKYIGIPFIEKSQLKDYSNITKLNNLHKLDNNIIRAKTKIKDLILCNDFYYFVTLTFNDKNNRYDLKTLRKKVNQRVRDFRKKIPCTLHFLFIPEKHKNGAWHFHGVLSKDFSNFISYNSYGYLTCSVFDSLGFVNVSLINSSDKISSYITKYITKDLSNRQKGEHLYFCSNGLQKPIFVKEYIYNNLLFDKLFFDYHNDYCSIRYDNELKNLNFLK